MSTPLAERMRTDAAAYPALQALLGTTPFRWFADQLPQGTAFPAVVVTDISGSPTYVVTGRLHTGWSRMQFLIWGGQKATGATARTNVEAALLSFLDQWEGGIGIPNLSQYPNLVVLQRNSVYTQTDGPIYQKIVDAMIFSNSSLN